MDGETIMRFFIVRNEQNCRGCGSTMMPGEEAVVILVYDNVPLTFHIGCFPEWSNTMFNHRLEEWRQNYAGNHRKVKPKMGRPRKYVNPILANKLRTMANYYTKHGQPGMVNEILEKLSKLRA